VIYHYVVAGNFIKISRRYDAGLEIQPFKGIYVDTARHLLSLTVACRQTYLESASLVFSCNTFGTRTWSMSGPLDPFLKALLPYQSDAITTVRLQGCHFECQSTGGPNTGLLSTLAGLKVVIFAAKWRRTPGDANTVSEITSIVRQGAEKPVEVMLETRGG
jgi:hypothetical protein